MREIWKEIDGWPGYEVSDLGRVRCWRPRNRLASPPIVPRILKPTKSKGYLTVKLSNGGKRHTFSLHKLVLTTFVGKRPDELGARHLDGNREKNKLGNLVWDTQTENQRDRVKHDTHVRGSRHVNHKLVEEEVKEIKEMIRTGEYSTLTELSEMFGVSLATISAIKHGRNWAWLEI